MGRLDGQVAIVTGAARGIGAGIAAVLRAEGADVVIADLDARRPARAAEGLIRAASTRSRSPAT